MTGQTHPDQSRQLWLVPEEGSPAHGPVAEVALNLRSPRLYAYAIPPELAHAVRPGAFLQAPYGRSERLLEGVCVRVGNREWSHTRKPVRAVLPSPPLPPRLLELGLWIADYYACPPGPTLLSLAPAVTRRPRVRKIVCLRAAPAEPPENLPPKQARLLERLAAGPLPRKEALQQAGVGPSVAKRLIARGLVESFIREEPVEPAPEITTTAPEHVPEDDFVLTPAQQAALDALASTPENTFRVFLLFGLPGSGKTEVYVRAIRRVTAAGRQAVLLVPEIALATQIVDRLARRFARVAILHSRLTDRQRRETWAAIAAGQVDVIIGTRSAVFAPCPRLGLIVVDEEQDASYKNLAAPRLHARDAAIKRGQLEKIPVLLGSATPALETWYNAQNLPHYRLLNLPERVPGAQRPQARAVPIDPRDLGQAARVLSPELITHLRRTFDAGFQSILLHNRRGYAVHLRCQRCGLTLRCPRCAAPFVFHRTDDQVRCHRCGVRQAVTWRCPDDTCGGRLMRSGLAIQRLEEELAQELPRARVLRLDTDTMRRREDYADALGRFESGQADVLIGTQMVAKGLDFPRVRLVGVIDADALLWMPDFRAAEQVFQLVMQVVGRAGRKTGESLALVQCSDPDAPPIRCALRLDYEAFARQELDLRRRYAFPPFTRLARLVLADERPHRASDEARRLAERLRPLAARVHPQLQVGEPAPCPIQRLRELQRVHLLVRSPRDDSLTRLLRAAAHEKLLSPPVRRFIIDVDPLDML